MARYISLDAIKWALQELKDSCNVLFVDFLLVKREGLAEKSSIVITTRSTSDSARRLMGIVRKDGSPLDTAHTYFNPFVWQWRHDGYPRSGTYTSLERSNTLSPIIDVKTTRDGMELSFTGDYIKAVGDKLRRSRAKPLSVSAQALAIWVSRYDELPDDITSAKLSQRFYEEFNLNSEEAAAFFSPPIRDDDSFFTSAALDHEGLLNHLTVIAPIEAPAALPATEPENLVEDLPEDLVEYLRRDMLLPDALLRQLVTLLRAGKHLILTGPPGTGKSTLAARLAEVSNAYPEDFSFPASAGHIFTTATADWTTFDTLGGYMPSVTGNGLVFQEGLFLGALRENKWLVIDELNRADVDKAFGQFFTVLSGHSATMPFKKDGDYISLSFDRKSSSAHYDEATRRYIVGRDWRIIGTMNTFDRNLLFQLSAAFVRRFAVVHVGIPSLDEMHGWVGTKGLDPSELALINPLLSIIAKVRPLGPAIWGDVCDYMAMRTKHAFGASSAAVSIESSFIDAVTAYVLPQLDGVHFETLSSIESQILALIHAPEEKSRLTNTFREVF